MPRHPPARGGSTAPVIIDGTLQTTSAPLTVKTGKNLSGVEVWSGSAAAGGFLLRDSAGTLVGELGHVRAASDWVASSVATDIVVRSESGGIIIQSANVARGVKIWSQGNVGTNEGYIEVITNTGIKLGYTAASQQVIGDSVMTFTSAQLVFTAGAGGAQFAGLCSFANGITMTGGALATNATLGFPFLRTMAGTPTGAVADGAFVIDTTASKIWARIGGAWKQTVALT